MQEYQHFLNIKKVSKINKDMSIGRDENVSKNGRRQRRQRQRSTSNVDQVVDVDQYSSRPVHIQFPQPPAEQSGFN